MSQNPWWGLATALLLVLLNGFFVAAEFALVKIRPTQIEPLIKDGGARARVVAHMVEHMDAYLSASQLGITLASLALGWIGEPAFAWILKPAVMLIPGADDKVVHSVTIAAAFVMITALHIVLGEQAPKSFAIRKSVPTALWISLPLFAFSKAAFPLIWLLNKASTGLLRIVGIEPAKEHEMATSEEELRLMLSSDAATRLSDQKRELLENVFELSQRTARQVMVPRAEVVFLSTSRSMEEDLKLARTDGHTRFPLCTNDLDNILGIVHIKDLFQHGTPASLEAVMHPVKFAPETLTLDLLLRRMRRERALMVAVVDEYGGVSGIVTLENVIEELVGEIQDEFDEERPELQKKAENLYRISGGMLVVDVERALDVEFSDRDEDTIAGVLLSELGRPARVGDRVSLGPLDFEVLEVSHRTIKALEARLQPKPASSEPEQSTEK